MDNETPRDSSQLTTPTLYNITPETSLQWHKADMSEAVKALHYHQGNISQAATKLGIHRTTLSNYVSKSKELQQFVDKLRHDKEQGIYEQATDKIQELLNCDDLAIQSKIALAIYNKGQPTTSAAKDNQTNQDADTIAKVAQYLQSLRSAETATDLPIEKQEPTTPDNPDITTNQLI
jgi:predicted DNA-binding protein (UPF0251 family)